MDDSQHRTEPAPDETRQDRAQPQRGSPPAALPERIAVYGTLQRGAGAWFLLEPLVAEQETSVRLPGILYDTGHGYPALRPGDGPGAPAQVFRLLDPESALPLLDRYEGPEYERIPLRLGGEAHGWVYVWRGSVEGMPQLPNGWLS